MLTEAIMHDCVVKLLKNHDEESLECLCRLLTTIGKDLDFEKAKVGQDREWEMWLSGQGWKNGCGVFLFEDYFFSSGISVQHEKSSTLLCMFHHNLALLTPFCPLSWSLYNFQWCSPVVSHFQIFHLSTQSKSAQHILWVSFSNLPLTCSFQNMKI